jgi:hypothetical protein
MNKNIPKALREQVWLKYFGPVFEYKCYINWCKNKINVFNFECGHNIPRSKSGKTDINNLIPICTRCNKSMSNKWTIDEWNNMEFDKPKNTRKRKRGCCPFF